MGGQRREGGEAMSLYRMMATVASLLSSAAREATECRIRREKMATHKKRVIAQRKTREKRSLPSRDEGGLDHSKTRRRPCDLRVEKEQKRHFSAGDARFRGEVYKRKRPKTKGKGSLTSSRTRVRPPGSGGGRGGGC